MEEGSIESNMSQGKGVVKKSPFRVVGVNEFDRQTGGHNYDNQKGGRGRPPIDRNWTPVEKQSPGKGE